MIGELADLRRRAPWRPDRIDVPVLVMRGEHGHEHHRAGTDALVEILPDAVAHTVPGARHFGPNTHPDAVGSRITEFLRERL